MKTIKSLSGLIALALVACGGTSSQQSPKAAPSRKELAVDLIRKGLIKGDTAFVEQYVPENYIQHNPLAQDGRAGLLGYVSYLQGLDGPLEAKVVRVLQEDDLVVVLPLGGLWAAKPTTWLLKVGWRCHGAIRIDEVPAHVRSKKA